MAFFLPLLLRANRLVQEMYQNERPKFSIEKLKMAYCAIKLNTLLS